jgi:CheY-like chemotaxis protein
MEEENKKYKILVIDDDTLTREMYSERLQQEPNFDVVTAEDGLAGLDAMIKDKPDLVFTGIIMPRMDGFQLIESMKKDVNLSEIPVIISSHLGRQEDKDRAKELGIEHFIVRGENSPNYVVNLISSLLASPNASFVLKLTPGTYDYDLFMKVHFDGQGCPNGKVEDLLPVELKLEKSYPNKLYSVKLRCDLCEK